ncbi:hypothetical protein CC80DRAFT_588390 [Byssothecium circinans]|uniref:Uncharacterized protein n=1 Tax=Byssothecium circinans TaxID=147558 RepID=A0A6A5UPA4_9PLEO|nr:hypothetical protein CC80DRAFT_588390 [Byssothecium circinans]
MLLSNDVWAVYGIVVPREDLCNDCNANRTEPLEATTPTAPTQTALPTARVTSSSLSIPTAQPTKELRTGLKVGIGIAVGLLSVVLILVAYHTCFLRRRRQERALQRAVDEVERGTDKVNEERVVLESRISIVFEDEYDQEEEERGRHGFSLPRRE